MHRVQRHITVNRNKCSSDAMQAVSGYVEQHDVLPSMFTVREHLLFHARLRFQTTTVQRRYRVEHVIKILNLSKCADTRIGGELHGGALKNTMWQYVICLGPEYPRQGLIFSPRQTLSLGSLNFEPRRA